MINCEHFIFASGKTKKKNGYQVISRSNNITPKLLSSLENYVQPSGIDLHDFSQSRSLLIMKDKVAFTMMKNVGIGHDGRPNTIYSHTIIINISDFKKFDYDTRLFEKLYVENQIETQLIPLNIIPKKNNPDYRCIDIIGIEKFEYFFRMILAKQKIAIFDISEPYLLQSMLSLLPPSLRLISFSTLVIMPQIQSKFDLVQSDTNRPLFKKYKIMDLNKHRINQYDMNTLFNQCLYYLIEIIDSKNTTKLMKIYKYFESIPLDNDETKLSLSILMHIAESKNNFPFNTNILLEFIVILEKMPLDFMNNYLKKFEMILPQNIMNEHMRKNKIDNIIMNYNNKPLTYKNIVGILNKASNNQNRIDVLNKQIQLQSNEFISFGHEILVNAIGNNFDSQIIYCFLKHNELHNCIKKTLMSLKLDYEKKNRLIDILITYSLNNERIFIKSIFALKIFDFDNDKDIVIYHQLINKLFKMSKFYEKCPPKLISDVIHEIYDDANDILKSHHGRYAIRIYYALLNIIDYLLLVRTFELHDYECEINILKKKINSVVIDLNDKQSIIPFDLFHPIPSTLIEIIFPRNKI